MFRLRRSMVSVPGYSQYSKFSPRFVQTGARAREPVMVIKSGRDIKDQLETILKDLFQIYRRLENTVQFSIVECLK